MTALLELQSRIQEHVLGGGDAAGLVAGVPPLPRERLGIYVDAYRIRLVETLADTYGKTQAALGDARFDRACLRYIDAHVPTTRSLRWYGAHFADRLAEWAPAAPQWSELARLEWALRGAFDAADAPVLCASDLSGVAPEAWSELRFVLQPAACLLRFEHNAVAVWQALAEGHAAPDWQRGERPVTWLVWRRALQPFFRSLSPFESMLVERLLHGDTFAQACECASALAAGPPDGREPADAAAQIGVCLRQWLDDELLSAIA